MAIFLKWLLFIIFSIATIGFAYELWQIDRKANKLHHVNELCYIHFKQAVESEKKLQFFKKDSINTLYMPQWKLRRLALVRSNLQYAEQQYIKYQNEYDSLTLN